MTTPVAVTVTGVDIDQIADASGVVVVFCDTDARLDKTARRVNRLTRGAVERLVASETFAALKPGEAVDIDWPAGMRAEAVRVVRLGRRPETGEARRAGAAISKGKSGSNIRVLAGSLKLIDEVLLGLCLRRYAFTDHKTDAADRAKEQAPREVTVMVTRPEEVTQAVAGQQALAEGVFFTRDLVNEPSNILTTTEFADRLQALRDLGLAVDVLEEDRLEALGMRTLLSVGQGSASPTKVVVIEWRGGGDEAPFALVGKGVVFDTGGISLKPAAGMEAMTMDMGGAGVVSGVMKTLALRKARANVVGLVGLVENMPDGKASRPGDVITTMKGDTVEIISTDAEGRMVLADVLWYAQERFRPVGMVNLATLTGAIIIGLGHQNAGVFSNDDALCDAFLKAARKEGEGAWRMPLDAAYDKQLKSRIADMKNTGGRPAGSITAAKFLQRFVKDDVPWIHLDIAGVASVASETALAPEGATGWGVLALNRLIADRFEG